MLELTKSGVPRMTKPGAPAESYSRPLQPGTTIQPGERYVSADGQYFLIQNGRDNNFVVARTADDGFVRSLHEQSGVDYRRQRWFASLMQPSWKCWTAQAESFTRERRNGAMHSCTGPALQRQRISADVDCRLSESAGLDGSAGSQRPTGSDTATPGPDFRSARLPRRRKCLYCLCLCH